MNWFGARGDLEPEVAEEAEEQPGQADRKQRLPPFQGPGQLLRPRGGRNAKVAAITANSWRQASIPRTPTAASPSRRPRIPSTAQSTNGKASWSSRKSFQVKGQSKGAKGTKAAAETAIASDLDSDRASV